MGELSGQLVRYGGQLREVFRGSQLSERSASARSGFCGTPRDRASQVARSEGTRTAGSPFFWVLFFGEVYGPGTWETHVRGHTKHIHQLKMML